jgi:hypothetical protein
VFAVLAGKAVAGDSPAMAAELVAEVLAPEDRMFEGAVVLA